MGVLAGRQLSIKWALALCYHVGWRQTKLTKAVAVMTAESDRYTEAYNTNDNGTTDRGLYQINSIHDNQISPDEAFKPIPNATYAYALYRSRIAQGLDGFSPWYAYGGARYLLAYAATALVQSLGTWKKRILRVEKELG